MLWTKEMDRRMREADVGWLENGQLVVCRVFEYRSWPITKSEKVVGVVNDIAGRVSPVSVHRDKFRRLAQKARPGDEVVFRVWKESDYPDGTMRVLYALITPPRSRIFGIFSRQFRQVHLATF